MLPPEQEATFENASNNEGETPPLNALPPTLPGAINEEESLEDNNSPLGNASNVVEVPPSALTNASLTGVSSLLNSTQNSALNSAVPATGRTKRAQSAAQRKTMNNQAIERQALKNAGVMKPSVAMVATLASMKARGDSRYNSAFANAISGKPLGIYRPEKTAKARGRKGNTVINATVGVNSSAAAPTNFMSASPAANARANNGAAKNTIQGIQDMGTSAIEAIRGMMAASKTLTTELARTNNAAGLTRALNALPLLPLSQNSSKKTRRRVPRKKNSATPLPIIPEESEQNSFTSVTTLNQGNAVSQ